MTVKKIHINVSYGDHPGIIVGGIHTYNVNECIALSHFLGRENVVNWVGYDDAIDFKDIELWKEGMTTFNNEDLNMLKQVGLNVSNGTWKKTQTPVVLVDGWKWANQSIEVPNNGWNQRKHWIMQVYSELFNTNTLNASVHGVENALTKGIMCAAALLGLNGLPKDEALHCHEHLSASALLLIKVLRDYRRTIEEKYGGVENLIGFRPKYQIEGKLVATTHSTHLYRCFVNDSQIQDKYDLYSSFLKKWKVGTIERMFLIGDHNRDNLAKHMLENALLKEADVPYAISPMVVNECENLHNLEPKLVYNGMDIVFSVDDLKLDSTSDKFRNGEFKEELKKLRDGTTKHLFEAMKSYFKLPAATYENTYIIITSGRDDVSKGIPNPYVEVLDKLNRWLIDDKVDKYIFNLPLIMTWNIKDEKGNDVFNPEYFDYRFYGKEPNKIPYFVRLPEKNPHPFLDEIWKAGLANEPGSRVRTLVRNEKVEDYLRVVNGATMAVFPVLYGPFEYAPLETIAQGIPTITTNIIGLVQGLRNRNIPHLDYHDLRCIGRHEKTGIFVTGTDPSNIAHCIYDIIEKWTPSQLIDRGIFSYACASKFNSSIMAEDILKTVNSSYFS
jgi:hypothetical protein